MNSPAATLNDQRPGRLTRVTKVLRAMEPHANANNARRSGPFLFRNLATSAARRSGPADAQWTPPWNNSGRTWFYKRVPCEVPMFQDRSSEFSSSVSAIQKHLGAVQDELENIGRTAGQRGYAAASDAEERVGNALTSIASDFVDRFRNGSRQAARLGSSYGNDAVQRVSTEVQDRPLITLGVAAVMGLLIGAAVLGAARQPAVRRRKGYQG
jgi:ElaB/YqjD/DUF883 family membrane-anchored ribosome-binding protein